jgi:hypothetical protein
LKSIGQPQIFGTQYHSKNDAPTHKSLMTGS